MPTHKAQIVKELFWEHNRIIFTLRDLTLTPFEGLWDVQDLTKWFNISFINTSWTNLGQKLTHQWAEINVVNLDKVVKTIAQQMCVIVCSWFEQEFCNCCIFFKKHDFLIQCVSHESLFLCKKKKKVVHFCHFFTVYCFEWKRCYTPVPVSSTVGVFFALVYI